MYAGSIFLPELSLMIQLVEHHIDLLQQIIGLANTQ